jgi:outer membrane lipoprotein carrier protein
LTSAEFAWSALIAELKPMTTLRAQVEQLVLDQDGREVQRLDAELLLSKPHSFSWKIISPYEELTVTDGFTLWRYEADLEQVTITDFNNTDSSRSPLLILNGNTEELANNFLISAQQDHGAGEQLRFTLEPLSNERLFEELVIIFQHGQLASMHLRDSLGQQTLLTFLSSEINIQIDNSNFIFMPGPSIYVLDQRDANHGE